MSHLEDPAAAIEAFASQLAPGGRLLLDEVEWIRSEVEPFRLYLEHVEAALEARGQRLYVGARLASLAAGRRAGTVARRGRGPPGAWARRTPPTARSGADPGRETVAITNTDHVARRRDGRQRCGPASAAGT